MSNYLDMLSEKRTQSQRQAQNNLLSEKRFQSLRQAQNKSIYRLTTASSFMQLRKIALIRSKSFLSSALRLSR